MRQFRSVLALGLALLLWATSLSLAAARGQTGPAETIVICTGLGLQSIAVDAEGNPTGAPHPCPDGLAAMAALALHAPDLPRRAWRLAAAVAPATVPVPAGRSGPVPRSRGPPGRAD